MSDWPFQNLKTANLSLRALEAGDAPGYLDIFSDPQSMVFWSGEHITTLAEAEEMLSQDFEWVNSGEALCWGIALPETNQLIGKISLYLFSKQNRRAETGYILNRKFWGQGLMSEALAAVLRYAFEELGMHRIEADVDPDHSASLALLKKFGFVHEGVLRDRWFVHGEWHDSVMLGLLANEFKL